VLAFAVGVAATTAGAVAGLGLPVPDKAGGAVPTGPTIGAAGVGVGGAATTLASEVVRGVEIGAVVPAAAPVFTGLDVGAELAFEDDVVIELPDPLGRTLIASQPILGLRTTLNVTTCPSFKVDPLSRKFL